MYEMYPDAWAELAQPRPAAQPRRRARKEHSVRPLVLSDRLRSDA